MTSGSLFLEKVFIIVLGLILSAIGTLIIIGIKQLMKGQTTIKEEAKTARKVLHTKIEDIVTKLDNYSGRLIQLESFHKTNHPGQLP